MTIQPKGSSTTGAGRGLIGWWLAELADLTGTGGVARKIPARCIIAVCEGDAVEFYRLSRRRRDNIGRVDSRFGRGRTLDTTTDSLIRGIKRSGLPVIVRLGTDKGLVCQDLLPAGARSDIRSIIANKLDLLTPWSDDKAYFDVRPSGARRGNRFEVDIAVAPKEQLDRAMELLTGYGLEIAGVDVQEYEPTAPPRFDLLAPYQGTVRRPLSIVLALVAILLAAAFGGVSAGLEIWTLEQGLKEQRGLVAELENRLSDLPELRQRIETLRAENVFVATRYMDRPSALVAIETLSRLLPDDVWLESIVLDGRRLTLSGFAREASQLLSLVESNENFSNALFRAPSTRVERPGDGGLLQVDQFSLATDIVSRREAQF